MSNSQQKSTKLKNQSHQTTKKALIGGSIIATLIAISPFYFNLHESVPETETWDTFLFTYTSTHFGDVNYMMWILTGKAVPLFFLFIWFFTNRHWWYHVLLVPIIMYCYQIFSLFNDDLKYIDEFQILHLLPIMAIVIPSIYLLRARMFNKINDANKSLEELEEEFKVGGKGFFGKLSDYF